MDKKQGTWKYYFPNGQLSGVINYKDDKGIEVKYWNSDGTQLQDNKEANVVAKFNGGFTKLSSYLQQNFKHSSSKRIKGTVVVDFIIDEQGNIINPRIKKSVNPELDKEALRVVSEMPKWKPCKVYNRYSKIKFVLPIVFN